MVKFSPLSFSSYQAKRHKVATCYLDGAHAAQCSTPVTTLTFDRKNHLHAWHQVFWLNLAPNDSLAKHTRAAHCDLWRK